MRRISEMGIEELALRQGGLFDVSSGLSFARKDEAREKTWARNQILMLFTRQRWEHGLSILTMPGLHWTFEMELLKQREGHAWQRDPVTKEIGCVHRTYITAVENDRLVYMASAVAYIPGVRQLVRMCQRPRWGERAIATNVVGRYYFANAYDLMEAYTIERTHQFDAAWLDFQGPPSLRRMHIIRAFYDACIRKTLIVTFLKARWDSATSSVIQSVGGIEAWLKAELPGTVLHCLTYQDGASPMIQLAVEKS